MPQADRQDIAVEYLPQGGTDFTTAPHAYVSLDLAAGKLSAHGADEFAYAAPLLVDLGWVIRWPIPPLSNREANALLCDLVEHAARVVSRCTIGYKPDLLGNRAPRRSALDTIHRRCAETWRAHGANGRSDPSAVKRVPDLRVRNPRHVLRPARPAATGASVSIASIASTGTSDQQVPGCRAAPPHRRRPVRRHPGHRRQAALGRSRPQVAGHLWQAVAAVG